VLRLTSLFLFFGSFYSEKKQEKQKEKKSTASPLSPPLQNAGILLDLPSGKQFDSSVNVIPATLDSSIPSKATN
jgi:hypothetical protein